MKFAQSLILSYAVLSSAAVVYVTNTVTQVIGTQYLTITVAGAPATTASAATTSLPSLSAKASSSTSLSVPTTLSTATTSSAGTTTSSTTSSSSSSLSSFASAILAEHNAKRALHDTPALTWNQTLADYAADYAASTFDCDNVALVHSGGPYGENLAAGYVGGAAPVDAWYNEISSYDYSNPGYSSATGHFTQVIWKSTTQLGCAYVTCDNAWRQYTICEYSPAGNVVGTTSALTAQYFTANVLPLA